jgi:hypothetical protein
MTAVLRSDRPWAAADLLLAGEVTSRASASRVCLLGLASDPVIVDLLVTSRPRASTLVALSVSTERRHTSGVQLYQRRCYDPLPRRSSKPLSPNPVLVPQIERPGDGVLVGGDHTGTALAFHGPTVDAGCLDEGWRAAEGHAVEVDHSTWSGLYRRACRYLVPEHG